MAKQSEDRLEESLQAQGERAGDDSSSGDEEKRKRKKSKCSAQRDDVFVAELRQFMKEQHYTQFDMASFLNCSQAKISHFLCCYMSEKAHAKMVAAAKTWKDSTDHAAGLEERAKRAYLSQLAQHHTVKKKEDSMPGPAMPAIGLVPAALLPPVPPVKGGRGKRVKRKSESSVGSGMSNPDSNVSLVPQAYTPSPPFMPSHGPIPIQQPVQQQYVYQGPTVPTGRVEQQGCRSEHGLDRPDLWCNGCRAGQACLRFLTDTDVAVAYGLLSISRGSPSDTHVYNPWTSCYNHTAVMGNSGHQPTNQVYFPQQVFHSLHPVTNAHM